MIVKSGVWALLLLAIAASIMWATPSSSERNTLPMSGIISPSGLSNGANLAIERWDAQ